MNFLFYWEVNNLMKNKCTVIQLGGLRGIFILGFVILCAIAGFIIFPAWCCQHAWNFIAGYVTDMPLMELKHGALLWVIIALISYVTYFNRFKIAVVASNDDVIRSARMPISDEEIINAIERRIKEKQALKDNQEKCKEQIIVSAKDSSESADTNNETSTNE